MINAFSHKHTGAHHTLTSPLAAVLSLAGADFRPITGVLDFTVANVTDSLFLPAKEAALCVVAAVLCFTNSEPKLKLLSAFLPVNSFPSTSSGDSSGALYSNKTRETIPAAV